MTFKLSGKEQCLKKKTLLRLAYRQGIIGSMIGGHNSIFGKEKCLTVKAVKTRAAAHRETTPEARSVLEEDLYISVSEEGPDDEETETATKPIDWKLKPIDPRTTERMAMTAVEAAIKIPSQVLAAVIDAEDQLSTEEVTQKLMNDWHVPPVANCIVRRRVADVKAVQARRKLKEFGLAPMPEDA